MVQALASSVKYFPNRYPGKCDVCGKRVHGYAGVCWKPVGSGNYLVAHAECLLTPEELAEKKAAEAAAEEARRLKLEEEQFERQLAMAMRADAFAKCDLKRLSRETRQYAYSDVTTEVYSFKPGSSDDDLKLALNEPSSGSLSNSLRSYGGAGVSAIDREKNQVRVVSSVNLCD